MLSEKLSKFNIILASKSPRRQELLKSLNLDFEIKTKEVEEIFSPALYREEIPVFLSNLKAKAFENEIGENDLIITSDTIVWHQNKQLGKPKDSNEAKEMLQSLAGNQHQVITSVTLFSKEKTVTFYDVTQVFFKSLTEQEIDFYIKNYKPFDKAGSYGIQEWIGFAGIEKIEGDYFNVVGLPMHKLYLELREF